MTASGHAARDRSSPFRVISSGGGPLPPAPGEKFRAGFGPYTATATG